MHRDAIVIGGGFYGARLALALRAAGESVLLVEREPTLLARASLINQARVHQGYHYPRSVLTAVRSRQNYDRFRDEYADALFEQFDHYYAIARGESKTTAAQFAQFCRRVGAPIEPAPESVRKLFDASRIEDVFLVRECAFDAVKLRERMSRDLTDAGVEVMVGATATRVTLCHPEPDAVTLSEAKGRVWTDPSEPDAVTLSEAKGRVWTDPSLHFAQGDNAVRRMTSQGLEVEIERKGQTLRASASAVYNCTYSALNELLSASDASIIPLKRELAEMALVEPPAELRGVGVTVMDGPFFSMMPYPSRPGLCTLSHVRYTPHCAWFDAKGAVPLSGAELREGYATRFPHMVRDAARFLPAIAGVRYVESIFEIKGIMPRSEQDDSRPILFRESTELPGLFSVLGAKIDSVYDVEETLRADSPQKTN